jgi:uncharacterized membrane protein (UPF0127 family)
MDRRLLWLGAGLALLAGGLVLAFALAGGHDGDDGDQVERIPLGDFGEVGLTVETDESSTIIGCLLAAVTTEQRQRGLMEVTDLQGYDGMAFIYDADTNGGFYMRNTPMPLSIAWVSDDGTVVDTADMEPCADRSDCPTYPSSDAYRVAVEVPQGELDELGIVEGSTVTVGGDCAAGT